MKLQMIQADFACWNQTSSEPRPTINPIRPIKPSYRSASMIGRSYNTPCSCNPAVTVRLILMTSDDIWWPSWFEMTQLSHIILGECVVNSCEHFTIRTINLTVPPSQLLESLVKKNHLIFGKQTCHLILLFDSLSYLTPALLPPEKCERMWPWFVATHREGTGPARDLGQTQEKAKLRESFTLTAINNCWGRTVISEHLHSSRSAWKWAHKKDGDASALKKQLHVFCSSKTSRPVLNLLHARTEYTYRNYIDNYKLYIYIQCICIHTYHIISYYQKNTI